MSDPAPEDGLIDRVSFQRLVGFSFSEEVPDFATTWRFRERLVKAGLMERMFAHLKKWHGYRQVRYLPHGRITVFVDGLPSEADNLFGRGMKEGAQCPNEKKRAKKPIEGLDYPIFGLRLCQDREHHSPISSSSLLILEKKSSEQSEKWNDN